MGDLLNEFDEIIEKQDNILFEVSTNLLSTMRISARRGGGSPVDTGHFRSSWTEVEKRQDGYQFTNTATYADVLAGGRREVNGKWYGSRQLPNGIKPIIQKHDEILTKKLKGIK